MGLVNLNSLWFAMSTCEMGTIIIVNFFHNFSVGDSIAYNALS